MTEFAQRPSLKWSTQLNIIPQKSTPALRGDKIILPPSALQQLLSAATIAVSIRSQPQTSTFDPYNPYTYAAERQARENLVERQQQLPHPLTFRLVNPENGRIVYAGIREFSAGENEVGISTFLRNALHVHEVASLNGTREVVGKDSTDDGTEETNLRLTVHVEELPKGTFVKLRPLEAGYDPEDWKALLEQYLRDNYTTLTNGEILAVPAGKEVFQFLVDGLEPNAEAITLVDTDIEVDIEPLNEEQAKETLQRLVEKSTKAPGTSAGSSIGGKLDLNTTATGQVRPGEYVDYTMNSLDHTRDLEVELTANDDEQDLDLFLSPYGSKHRIRPREDEHVFGDFSTNRNKRIKIRHTNVELEHAEALWVSVRGSEYPNGEDNTTVMQYELRVSSFDDSSTSNNQMNGMAYEAPPGPDEERCSNCQQAVPSRTMFLHQNFCLRNNILCPKCRLVFQKTSAAWKDHWHCLHDDSHGNNPSSKAKHDRTMHSLIGCSSCDYTATNISYLAHHRTSTCPGKLILCQFCHLQVPQQGPDDAAADSAEVIISGLTPHELSDGARTTECHICSKIIRLRDMTTHIKHHDLQRISRSLPRICRNVNCGRTLDGISKGGEVRVQGARNDLGVCDACFGPLYVSMYDPDGKALKRRVERRYLTQLLTGCNQPWCRNDFCKTGRKNLGSLVEGQSITSKEALTMIKPTLDKLKVMSAPVSFCTDEASQKRRTLAEMIAAECGSDPKGKGKSNESIDSGYDPEWCVAAVEAEAGDLDRARSWLKNYAPTRAESRR